MSKFLALIIDSLNHDITIGTVMNPTDKIHTHSGKEGARRKDIKQRSYTEGRYVLAKKHTCLCITVSYSNVSRRV